MAFTIWVNGNTGTSAEMRNNFVHISELFPRTGNSLSSVDLTNNLGTNVNRWNNIYVNNYPNWSFQYNKAWELLAEINITASTSQIDISFASSTSDNEYMLVMRGICNNITGAVLTIPRAILYFNTTATISTNSFHGACFFSYKQEGVAPYSINMFQTWNYLSIGRVGGQTTTLIGNQFFSVSFIKAVTLSNTVHLCGNINAMTCFQTSTYHKPMNGFFINPTTSTFIITDFKFIWSNSMTFDSGTYIGIWRRNDF